MIEAITRLVNRYRGEKTTMKKELNIDEPLYGAIQKPRCPLCKGPMICVNDRTHKMACADPMCRR